MTYQNDYKKGNQKSGNNRNYDQKKLVMDEGDYDDILIMKSNKAKLVDLIDKINKFVKTDLKNITSNQLRNIYDELNKSKNIIDVQLVRPKLAYIAGRQKDTKIIVMYLDGLLKKAGKNIQANPEAEKSIIENIQEFFAALVSYHKLHFGEK